MLICAAFIVCPIIRLYNRFLLVWKKWGQKYCDTGQTKSTLHMFFKYEKGFNFTMLRDFRPDFVTKLPAYSKICKYFRINKDICSFRELRPVPLVWLKTKHQTVWLKTEQQSVWLKTEQQSVWLKAEQQSVWHKTEQQSVWHKTEQQSVWLKTEQ